jgi:hypothetical protein
MTMATAMTMLLASFSCSANALLVAPPATMLQHRHSAGASRRSSRARNRSPTTTFAALSLFSTSTTTDTTTITIPQQQDDARELLALLVDRHGQVRNKKAAQEDQFIQDCISRLSNAQVTFDPADCLNGPLYAVLHQQGPQVPLWEKIGIFANNKNIKGQKYTFNQNEGTFDLINYAELLGKGTYSLCTTASIYLLGHGRMMDECIALIDFCGLTDF